MTLGPIEEGRIVFSSTHNPARDCLTDEDHDKDLARVQRVSDLLMVMLQELSDDYEYTVPTRNKLVQNVQEVQQTLLYLRRSLRKPKHENQQHDGIEPVEEGH